MDTLEFSGINHRSQSGIGSGPPTGTEAADHLAMDDRRSQSPFGAIIGWLDIRSVQEDEQSVTMFEKAALQAGSLILARRALQQSITKLLQAADLLGEVFRRHFLALIVQLDGGSKYDLHGSWPESGRIQIDGCLQGTQLVRQAQLALQGGSLQLRCQAIAK